MTGSAKQVFQTIYQTMRLHQEMIHETLCATNALVRAVCETDSRIARRYEKYHVQTVADTLRKSNEALSNIDAMIDYVKGIPE